MMVLTLIVLLSVLAFILRFNLGKRMNNNKKQVVRYLKNKLDIESNHDYPILFLSMEAPFFEEIVSIVSDKSCKSLIIIFEAPAWYFAIKNSQWTNHYLIPFTAIKKDHEELNDSFIWTEKDGRIIEIKNTNHWLKINYFSYLKGGENYGNMCIRIRG